MAASPYDVGLKHERCGAQQATGSAGRCRPLKLARMGKPRGAGVRGWKGGRAAMLGRRRRRSCVRGLTATHRGDRLETTLGEAADGGDGVPANERAAQTIAPLLVALLVGRTDVKGGSGES